MSRRVVFRPQAAQETQDSRHWYETQRPGLGARFADAIEDTLGRIADNPAAFARVHGDIRRAVLHAFPFGIYFRERDDEIVILAVLHARRRPRHWPSR